MQFAAEQVSQTLADGLRTQSIGPINFEHMKLFVDDIITVSEAEIYYERRGDWRRIRKRLRNRAGPSR